jgi:AraC-like DNA-binding protein
MRRYRGFFPVSSPADQEGVTIHSVGRSNMQPSQRVNRADGWHSWQFMLTLSGAGIGDVAGRPFAVEPGGITLMPMEHGHRYQVRPGAPRWEYLWVEFRGSCATKLLAMLGLAGRAAVPGCGEVGELVDRIFDGFEARGDTALHENTALFMQVLALVERCARRPAQADRRIAAVDRVRQHMADHLADDLVLEDLAGVAGLSTYHLSRLFTAQTQVPPMRFLRRLRANRAKALLHRRELKAAEVGRLVGYPTLQHFSRMFKQETGMTVRRFVREVVRHGG